MCKAAFRHMSLYPALLMSHSCAFLYPKCVRKQQIVIVAEVLSVQKKLRFVLKAELSVMAEPSNRASRSMENIIFQLHFVTFNGNDAFTHFIFQVFSVHVLFGSILPFSISNTPEKSERKKGQRDMLNEMLN